MVTHLQMDLGGKNPLIVMPDAYLDHAARLAIQGGFALTGQACTGTSRILVDKRVKQEFTEKLLAAVEGLKVGNGFEEGVVLGPLRSEERRVGKECRTRVWGSRD